MKQSYVTIYMVKISMQDIRKKLKKVNKHNSVMNKQYFTDISILKGIGIILMVLGHMHFSITFNYIIFGFHMPLFFIVSGYLYRKPEKYGVYIRKKCRSLLIPYLVFGIVYSCVKAVGSDNIGKTIKEKFIAVFIKTTYDLPIESALWFLVALLWVCIIYAGIDIFFSEKIKLILIVIVTVIGCLWKKYFNDLPWALNSAMASIGFFYIGVIFRKHIEQKIESIRNTLFVSNSPKLRACIGVVILITIAILDAFLILKNGKINLRTGMWANIPLSFFNGVCYTGVCLGFARLLDKSKLQVIKNVFSYIGAHSVVFVCINHPAIAVVKKVIGSLWKFPQYMPLQVTIEFILAMSLMVLAAEIIMKTKLCYIVGKY